MARDPLAQPEEAIRRLYAYVAYRIGDGPDAEDVTSQTIERALRYRDSFDPRKGSPAGWLVAIASRVIVDFRAGQVDQIAFNTDDHGAQATDFSAAAAQRLELREAMALLDDRSRELLALRYGSDLKAREIGVVLGMRTNAVEVALTRALGRLRAILEDPAERREGVQSVSAMPEV